MEILGDIFGEVLHLLSHSKAYNLKIGKWVIGLLRPDSVIAYFGTEDDLRETAETLAHAFTGVQPQGVPFTAEITDGGFLSWGMDPPRDEPKLDWQERESWRLWITNRLASALFIAKSHQNSRLEPWQFALDRLRLEGIDTASWIPTESFRRNDE
jgi:hypothetical protein